MKKLITTTLMAAVAVPFLMAAPAPKAQDTAGQMGQTTKTTTKHVRKHKKNKGTTESSTTTSTTPTK